MINKALSAIKDSFLGGDRCYLEDTSGKRVIFHSVDSESWSGSTTVSSYAIENREDVSDHIKVGSDSISLKVTLTNHTGINILNPKSMTRINPAGGVDDLISDNLKILKQWRSKGELLTYYGAVSEPESDLVITQLSPSKDSSTGEAVDISISLQRVVIASEKKLRSDIPISVRETQQKGNAKKFTKKISLK